VSVVFMDHRLAVWCDVVWITVRRFAQSCKYVPLITNNPSLIISSRLKLILNAIFKRFFAAV
jgi:hypothetical protein